MRTFTTFYVCMYIIAFVSHFFKKTLIIILVFLCTTKSDAFLLLKFANYGKLEKWDLFIFLSPFWKWSTLLIFSLIFCILHSCIFELKKKSFLKAQGALMGPDHVQVNCMQLKVNCRPKVNCRIKFGLTRPTLGRASPNCFLTFVTQFTFSCNLLVYDPAPRAFSQFPQPKQTQQKIIIGFPAMWSLPEKWKKVLAVLPLMKLKEHTHCILDMY